MSGWGNQSWGADPWGSGSQPPAPSGASVVSTYTIDGETTNNSPMAVTTSETLFHAIYYNVVVNWGAIPGATVVPGLAGRFVTGNNPVVLRIRAGGRPLLNQAAFQVVGTVVFQVTLPANTTTDLGAVGAAFTKPSAGLVYSNLQVTVQATGGSSTIAPDGVVVTLRPDDTGTGQGVMLSSGRGTNPSGSEAVVPGVGYEWIVDFDQYENVDSLLFGFAVFEDAAFGGDHLTVRIRIGGTDYAIDGSLVLAVTDPDTTQAPFDWIIAGSATVANTFTGPQLVKMTWDGRAGPGFPTVIIREA